MIARRDTLAQALTDIEAGGLGAASTVIVSLGWWDSISAREQDRYRERAERAGVQLHADDAMSAHFVEVRGGDIEPSLSTEHPT
jgi:uncharacterized protein (DUF934 family)